MILFHFIALIIIFTKVLPLSSNKLPSVSLRNNPFNQQKIVLTSKIKTDMYRIKQILEPLHRLYNSRDVYRKYNNILKTLWTCCPAQRIYMFDLGDTYQTITGRADCRNFIRDNKNRLTNQCQKNLKLFDPIRGDIRSCDGRLLRNLADRYMFVVQLSNYTERWCMDGLYPMLIYSDINQILPCESAIRRGLRKDPQSYATYDTLSRNILDVYVRNLHNYRDCDDPHFWDKEDGEEEIDPSLPMIEH